MQQGFVFFHTACTKLRHLLITLELLQRALEEHNGEPTSSSSDALPHDLMLKLLDFSNSVVDSMELFLYRLLQDSACHKTAQQFYAIESSCQQMLDANAHVVQCAKAVCRRFSLTAEFQHELDSIATRTIVVQQRLLSYSEVTAPLGSLSGGMPTNADMLLGRNASRNSIANK